jgi:hypothetical protein
MDRRVYYGRLVAAQARSGLSARDFCRRRRLSVWSFYMWRKRLRSEATDSAVAPRPVSAAATFVPVQIDGVSSCRDSDRPAVVEVVLAGGVLIRLPMSYPVESVARLAATLAKVQP